MNDQPKQSIRFDGFELDTAHRRLIHDGEPLAISAKAFDLLAFLAENAGRIVTKDEILDAVWADHFVEEANLKVQISALRKVLGEGKDDHRFLVTVPGKGYEFVADVENGDDEIVVEKHKISRVIIEDEISEAEIPALPAAGSRKISAISAIVLLLVLGTAAFVWLRNDKTQTAAVSQQNAASEPMTMVRLSNLGRVSGSSISPDGKFVAYGQNHMHGSGSLYVRQIDTNTESQLLEPGERIFGTTAFSPDGAFIYFIVYDQKSPDGALYRIPVVGENPTKVLDNVQFMFALSPDGKRAAFFRNEPAQRQKSLIIAALDGSGEQKALTRPWDEMKFQICPAWSPDGSAIAFGATDFSETKRGVRFYTVKLENGAVEKFSEETWAETGKINWMPDGSGLVFVGSRPRTGNQLYFLSYPAGEPQQITKELNEYGNYGLGITADGKTLTADFLENSAQLWALNADGSTADAEQLTTGASDGSRGLTSFTDGQIVYTTRTGDVYDLWMIGEKEGKLEKTALTSDAFAEIEVSAAPDGSFIVFASNRAGNRHLFRAEADGSNVRQLTFGDGFESAPEISPGGDSLIYVSQSKLWRIPAAGGDAVQLTDFECVMPAFSPDGKSIACILPSKSIIKNATLAVLSAEGGQPIKRFEVIPFAWNYRAARWTPDGQALVFHKTVKQIDNLWKQDLAGGEPKPFTDFKSDMIFNYIFSRDGKRIIVSRGKRVVTAVLLKNFK